MKKVVYLLTGLLAVMYAFHFSLPRSTDILGKWVLVVEDEEFSSIEVLNVDDREFECRIKSAEGWNRVVKGKLYDEYIEVYEQSYEVEPWMRLKLRYGFFGNIFAFSHPDNTRVWYRD